MTLRSAGVSSRAWSAPAEDPDVSTWHPHALASHVEVDHAALEAEHRAFEAERAQHDSIAHRRLARLGAMSVAGRDASGFRCSALG
jgi:hypothetical protein